MTFPEFYPKVQQKPNPSTACKSPPPRARVCVRSVTIRYAKERKSLSSETGPCASSSCHDTSSPYPMCVPSRPKQESSYSKLLARVAFIRPQFPLLRRTKKKASQKESPRECQNQKWPPPPPLHLRTITNTVPLHNIAWVSSPLNTPSITGKNPPAPAMASAHTARQNPAAYSAVAAVSAGRDYKALAAAAVVGRSH